MSLGDARRLVVKIGSALLVDRAAGAIRHAWLTALAEDIAALRQRGCEVIVVSSGAVAIGRTLVGLTDGTLALEQKQACAAVGQIHLAHAWLQALAPHGIGVAQVLLTLEDTEARRRHLNGRATLTALLALGQVPVINENDTIATQEIRFGDNDRLAARVAQMASADTAVLLSDIDGLYTADPRKDPNARHLPEIRELTPEILAMAGDPPPGYSSGGMITKLQAARIALAAGCRMAIADGRGLHPLAHIEKGGRASWFLPSDQPTTARKRWIAGVVKPAGRLVIDAGARRALAGGASLLPAGVRAVEGSFERGDVVLVADLDGVTVARGLVAYDATEASALAGRRSQEIETILGWRGRDEMIHRDDLVVEI